VLFADVLPRSSHESDFDVGAVLHRRLVPSLAKVLDGPVGTLPVSIPVPFTPPPRGPALTHNMQCVRYYAKILVEHLGGAYPVPLDAYVTTSRIFLPCSPVSRIHIYVHLVNRRRRLLSKLTAKVLFSTRDIVFSSGLVCSCVDSLAAAQMPSRTDGASRRKILTTRYLTAFSFFLASLFALTVLERQHFVCILRPSIYFLTHVSLVFFLYFHLICISGLIRHFHNLALGSATAGRAQRQLQVGRIRSVRG
jgi:hypothetical protein